MSSKQAAKYTEHKIKKHGLLLFLGLLRLQGGDTTRAVSRSVSTTTIHTKIFGRSALFRARVVLRSRIVLPRRRGGRHPRGSKTDDERAEQRESPTTTEYSLLGTLRSLFSAFERTANYDDYDYGGGARSTCQSRGRGDGGGGDGDDGRSQIFYDTTQYPLASPLKRGLRRTRRTRDARVKNTLKHGGHCFGGAFTTAGIIRPPVRRFVVPLELQIWETCVSR